MSSIKFKWVRRDGGGVFSDVGILDDGSLHNPLGYPEDLVRAAIAAALERRAVKRSNAATKAAVTRKRRCELRVHQVARGAVASLRGRTDCYICGKHLSDQISIDRGIGSECWEHVLQEIERAKVEAAA